MMEYYAAVKNKAAPYIYIMDMKNLQTIVVKYKKAICDVYILL